MVPDEDQLVRLKVPTGAWEEISATDRYSVLILGHIYNELMILQRATWFSGPADTATPVEQNAGSAQMMFFARMLCSKIYEAQTVIKKPQVLSFLRDRCFPLMGDGKGERELNAFFERLETSAWLAKVRNKHSMHYPTFGDWSPAIAEMTTRKMPFEYIAGHYTGESFFLTSEHAANLGLYLTVNPDDWKKGGAEIANEIKEIARLLGALINNSMNEYLVALWESPNGKLPKLQRKLVKKFERVEFDGFRLPYFFKMKKR